MPSCSVATVVRNAEEIGAVSHHGSAVVHVAVVDEAQAIHSYGHGGVPTDFTRAVQGVRVADVQVRLAQRATLRVRLFTSW
jgi:predicted amino acid dehydrogenase